MKVGAGTLGCAQAVMVLSTGNSRCRSRKQPWHTLLFTLDLYGKHSSGKEAKERPLFRAANAAVFQAELHRAHLPL